MQAPFMFLGEGKHAHDHQSHQDKSGYDVVRHGCYSRALDWRGMTFLRIVIPLHPFVWSMIFSESRYTLFRIMLWRTA
jgi:hypothetical protein